MHTLSFSQFDEFFEFHHTLASLGYQFYVFKQYFETLKEFTNLFREKSHFKISRLALIRAYKGKIHAFSFSQFDEFSIFHYTLASLRYLFNMLTHYFEAMKEFTNLFMRKSHFKFSLLLLIRAKMDFFFCKFRRVFQLPLHFSLFQVLILRIYPLY